MRPAYKGLSIGFIAIFVLIPIITLILPKSEEKSIISSTENAKNQNVFIALKNVVKEENQKLRNINSLKIQIGDRIRRPGTSRDLEDIGWSAIKALDKLADMLVEAKYAVMQLENAPPHQIENASERIRGVSNRLVAATDESRLACSLFFSSVKKNPN